ncbi:hypothetical protein [Actinomadura chibensis]|uniref:Uncharacterized protein n=1 Tax=Actinomadura chibensis TaxID=392828 RepID=A0A5D0N9S2_9ACTN|nr:hypothetical protein [Actinomadura chibensis]TYB41102.1 hypothetical protein FXF69_36905 [Actinomadura chibensis]
MGESVRPRVLDRAWRSSALALVGALEARGLVAEVWGHGAVRARNPAGEPDADSPSQQGGQVMGPALGQEVVCRHREGVLWWWWVWPGLTRQCPPDLEPLCPVTDPEAAADRIARVVAVPFANSPVEQVASGGRG